MIGTELLRFKVDQKYLLFDVESEGLNLAFHRPWELSYSIATIKDGIQSSNTRLIRWDPLNISAEAARLTRFNKEEYEARAEEPRAVWDDFSQLLYSPEYRVIGHNLNGFDSYMINTWRAAMGLPSDYSFTSRSIDTLSLSRAYKGKIKPDLSSFLAWQYRLQDYRLPKGVKASLGTMCSEFGIEYDERAAHGASYDVERNWLVFRELVFRMDV